MIGDMAASCPNCAPKATASEPPRNAKRYYRHSGVCPPLGFLGGLTGGVVASALVALLYVAIAHYNRFVYLGLLLTFLAGALSAFAGMRGLKLGRVRNDAATHFTAAVCGLTTLYVAWILWVAILLHRPGIGLVPLVEVTKHPSILWETILWINERGTWSTRHGTEPVVGAMLWCVWGLEALCLAGIGVLASMTTKEAFCEACQVWCVKDDNIGFMAIGDADETRKRVKDADLRYLTGLGRPKEGDVAWLTVTLTSCPGCKGLHTLSVVASRQNSMRSLPVGDLFKNPMLLNGLIIDAAEAELVRLAARS